MQNLNPLHGSGNRQFQPIFALILLLGVMLLAALPAAATTYNWTGASATSQRWSDTSNWNPAGKPANGDSINFGVNLSAHLSPTNDLSGLTLNQITFTGGLFTNYMLLGNAFTLTGGIYATNELGTTIISNSISVGTGAITLVASNGENLELCGQISGSGTLTKLGAGTVTYQYNGDNINTGTTYVYAGLLQLNVHGSEAFGGPVVIGEGSGTAATVRYLQLVEIGTGIPITLNDGGVLDLNNTTDFLGPNLTFNGAGTIQTGTGTLTLAPGTTVTYNAGAFDMAEITGNLDVNSGACTFAIGYSGLLSGDMVVWASISDSATIHKTGNGYLLLNGVNTYTGLMSVEGGTLVANNTQALGLSSAGVVVTNNASLALWYSADIAEPLVLASTSSDALQVDYSTNIWGGPITLVGGTSIDVENSAILEITNAISGTGNLTETGGARLEFFGNQRNTYTGTTYVNQGTLILSNSVGNGNAIPGGLVVNTNCVVNDLASYQIDSPFSAVTLNDLSQFNMSPGVKEWIGPLAMQGALINSPGLLYLGGGLINVEPDTNAPSVINGNAALWALAPTVINVSAFYFTADFVINANLAGETGASGMLKTGIGTMELTGNNTFGGSITVSNGGLQLFSSGNISSTNAGVTILPDGNVQMFGLNIGNVPLNLSGYLVNFFTNSWAGNITLTGTAVIETFSSSDGLSLSGIIGGTGGWIETGPGAVWLSGPTSNPYTGTTEVLQGTLMLNAGGVHAHAYGGPLQIGDGSGGSPTVRLAQFEELNQSQPLTIDDGTLDLNSFYAYSPTNVTLNNNAVIETENGTLYVQSNTVIAVTDVNSSAEIEGNLNLETNCTLDSLNQGADLFVSAAISGTGNLITGGTAYTILESSNSYSGLTEVAGGALWVQNQHALGATNNSVIVNNNATLLLYLDGGITNKTLVLNGQGLVLAPGESPIGNLFDESGYTNYWAGPITVNSNCLIGLGNISTALHLSGPISGPGGIEVTNSSPKNLSLYLDGTSTNSYSGATIVDAGALLLLNKPTLFTAVPGPLAVSGTVRQLNLGQQMSNQPLTIYDGGLFDLNGYYAYCGLFNGTPGAAVWLTGGAEFLPDFATSQFQTCAFNGVISGTGFLVLNGYGLLTLSNTNTYTGTTYIENGALQINGRQPQTPAIVYTGAFLSGTGQVGNVTCNGIISPGGATNEYFFGVGALTVSNLTMSSTAYLYADLYGSAPGNYDQLVILGTNDLGGAWLDPNPVFSKPVHVGDSMMLISNVPAGPLMGSFLGVTAGVPIYDEGYQLVPSYTGGSGNDFTVTESAVPAGALSGQIIGGNGNQGIDSDECNEISFAITNTGPLDMNGVSAVLSSTTPDVVVTQPYSTYPNILSGAAATNSDWFEISTLPQFSGGTTINLQLTVTSSAGAFVIPFTVATEASIDGGGTCGSCLATITNNITGSDPVETGEIKPAGGTSAYGAPKAWPGNFFGNYHYKVFTFTNTLATDAAVTVLVNAGCDVEAVAYVPAFDPSNISNNYAGDAGYYTISGVANFSFDAPAGSPFQIVVNEYTVNAGCSQYTLQLDGLPCPPPVLSIQPASTHTVQLTWPAWAGGFNLENAPIVTGPGWVGNTNQPVVTLGQFSVTNGSAGTNLFFRLHKP